MKKLIATVCLVLIVSTSLAFVIQKRIAPLTELQTKIKAQYIGNRIINETLSEILKDETADIYILQKDENGNIIAETTNVVAMNLLKAKIHSALNEKLADISVYNFGIPVGTLIGIDWLNNLGPSIPVSLIYGGTISIDIKNDFESAGINQTKHTSVLTTQTEVIAAISGRQISCTIDNEIPIAETIILGDVPNSYLYFDSQR